MIQELVYDPSATNNEAVKQASAISDQLPEKINEIIRAVNQLIEASK